MPISPVGGPQAPISPTQGKGSSEKKSEDSGPGNVRFRDPTTRTVGGVQLRKLTPEEKAAKRFRYNLVIVTVGFVVLVITAMVLRWIR